MIWFLSGGAKNGKSALAQTLVKACENEGPLYYIATMIPRDREDEARIAKHVEARAGWGFQTLECGTNILSALEKADKNGSFLLDSVTALLSNEMFHADGTMDEKAPGRVAGELETLAKSVRNIVFVSDFLYADAGKYDPWTERYREGLALADRRLAALADGAAELCAGCVYWYKGGDAK
jgi:adenosylcobinamide kinase/adenosylcobinamide-phosphate guanylyltransferase